MLNIKIRRFIAFYIDMVIIMIMVHLFCNFIIMGVNNPQIYPYMFLILVLLWAMFRDFVFQNKSFGKKVLHLSVYDENGNEIYDWKKLLLVNFLSTIVFSLSIIVTLLSGKSIGDIILGTNVFSSVKETEKIKNKFVINTIIKYAIIFLPIILLIIKFIFFQQLNFYSVRICGILIILSLFFIILKSFIRNLAFQIVILLFGGIIVFCFASNILFERELIKFKTIEDSISYSYHNKKIWYTYDTSNSTLVFLDDVILQYEKKGGFWNILNPLKQEKNTKNLYRNELIDDGYIYSRKCDFTYRYLNNLNKTVIMITIEYDTVVSLEDSVKTEFEKKEEMFISKYFAVIDGKLNNSYKLTINNEEFYPFI